MTAARVGIVILDYHEPEATLACVRRLLEVEGADVRVLWEVPAAGRFHPWLRQSSRYVNQLSGTHRSLSFGGR